MNIMPTDGFRIVLWELIRFLDVAAWPIVVIWLGYLFRPEIRMLLERMQRLKYKGLEASFASEIAKAEFEAEDVAREGRPKASKPRDEFFQVLSRYRQSELDGLAEQSPRAALIEAWIELERAIFIVAEECLDEKLPLHATAQIVFRLLKKEVISPQIFRMFEHLRRARNLAAHSADFNPPTKEVESYVNLAATLTGFFYSIAEQAQEQQKSD